MIRPHGVAVLLAIWDRVGYQTRKGFPGESLLAKSTGMTKRQVQREIATLKNFGMITVTSPTEKTLLFDLPERERLTNTYTITDISAWHIPADFTPAKPRKDKGQKKNQPALPLSGVATLSRQGDDSQSHKVTTEKITTKEATTTATTDAAAVVDRLNFLLAAEKRQERFTAPVVALIKTKYRLVSYDELVKAVTILAPQANIRDVVALIRGRNGIDTNTVFFDGQCFLGADEPVVKPKALTPEAEWEVVKVSMQERLSRGSFMTFVRPIKLAESSNRRVRLIVPDETHQYQIREYLPILQDCYFEVRGERPEIEVECDVVSAWEKELDKLVSTLKSA